jgi:putative transposase
MSREPYDSDVTDVEWLLLEPLIPPEKHGGRHRTIDTREVVNAIFYVLRTGCAWRLLPHDFPAWQTVYGYFRDWRKTGIWEQLNTALREAVREQEEREAEPSAAIMDSQSVKTTAVAATVTCLGQAPEKLRQATGGPARGRGGPWATSAPRSLPVPAGTGPGCAPGHRRRRG